MDSQSPVNQAKIKGNMMSTLKQDVNKMGTNEKSAYDALITKIGDYLAQGGNQATGSFNTLYTRLMDFIDKEMVNNQPAAPQSAPMGESGMYEGGFEEMSRFDEIFSGLDEDDTLDSEY
jgi:hypothetical protein